MLQTMRFWLDLGVDGFRLDAIPYLCKREGTDNANLPETHAIFKVFGRGEMTLLHLPNCAILAYIRHDATDIILVVANLSSQLQRVELDLTAYTGVVPREMLRRGESPPIETGPYALTLGPYACAWFRL
jgi:maltose alpha-D-glucosyltransferase/alpha-amylase